VDEEGKIVAETPPTTEAKCPKCGADMEVKRSKAGFFLACSTYPDCKGALEIAEVVDNVAIAAEPMPETDEVCEKCGAPMSVRRGKRGPFLACTKYPKCKNARDIGEIVDGKAVAAAKIDTGGAVCEKCGAEMVVKNGRRGPFLACSAYPKCKNAKPLPEGTEVPEAEQGATKAAAKPKAAKAEPIITEEKCPNCNKPLALRDGRFGPFLGCTGYPKCKTIVKASPDVIAKYKK
jgi:DNA topoisomerase-1